MEELDELRYIYQIYQNQYVLLNNSINLNLQELQELNSVQKALENSDTIKNNSTLMNLGANFYIRARVDKFDTVIVGVGGGYLMEKDSDSAKNFVSKLIQKKTENVNKLVKSKRELEAGMMDLSYKIDAVGN